MSRLISFPNGLELEDTRQYTLGHSRKQEHLGGLHAELDAICAHLYGPTRDELDYLLEMFPIVIRKDEEQWGELDEHNVLGDAKRFAGIADNVSIYYRVRYWNECRH